MASKVLHKEESISFIKFIGRQYDCLTSIMERINICYSLQVKLLFWIRVCMRNCATFDNFQIAVNIGAGFVFSILTIYSMYQYARRKNDFYGQKVYFHISYQIFYSNYACMVFYTGGLIAGDVNICFKLSQNNFFYISFFFH